MEDRIESIFHPHLYPRCSILILGPVLKIGNEQKIARRTAVRWQIRRA